MKTVIFMLMLMALNVSAEKRFAAGRTYDLDDPKAVATFSRVKGTVVGENAYGWVMNGSAMGPGTNRFNGQFILKNSPRERLVAFKTNKARHEVLVKERASLVDQQNSTDRAIDLNEADRNELSQGPIKGTSARKKAQNTQARIAATDQRLSANANAVSSRLRAVENEIDEIRRKGYNGEKEFTFSGVALPTNTQFQGMRIYDMGSLVK